MKRQIPIVYAVIAALAFLLGGVCCGVVFGGVMGSSGKQVNTSVTQIVTEISQQVVTQIAPGSQPTYTRYPTYTPLATIEPVVIVVTVTSTPEPLYTPTVTIDPLYAPKGPGFYLVGVDIAPGMWRSQGTGDKCYWKLADKAGEIIDNNYGLAGGTVNIAATVFQVEFGENCGTWIYLGQ